MTFYLSLAKSIAREEHARIVERKTSPVPVPSDLALYLMLHSGKGPTEMDLAIKGLPIDVLEWLFPDPWAGAGRGLLSDVASPTAAMRAPSARPERGTA